MKLEDLFRNIYEESSDILTQKFEIENARVVPEIDDISYDNYGKIIDAAVLFIDMRYSTDLTDNTRRITVARIYKCYLNSMVQAVLYNEGEIRGFAGDRIFSLFAGENPRTRAVDTAIVMQTILKYIFPKLNINISCGVGIDYGSLLAVKSGAMRNPNNSDLVWIGSPVNYASKFADKSDPGEIVISEEVYKNMLDDKKRPIPQGDEWWKRYSVKIAGKDIYVYCNKDLYKTAVKVLLNNG